MMTSYRIVIIMNDHVVIHSWLVRGAVHIGTLKNDAGIGKVLDRRTGAG